MLQRSLPDALRQTEISKLANELTALRVSIWLYESRNPIDFDSTVLAPLLFDMFPGRASIVVNHLLNLLSA